MRHSVTTTCRRFAHPEIAIFAADTGVVAEDVSNLLANLEHMVASGSTFEPGEHIQIGWLYGQFRQHDRGLLTLYEPDLLAFPATWTLGVTNILITKRVQVDVADSFGLRDHADFTSLRHSCLVCTNYSGRDDFFMSRVAPEGMVSGWFIGCVNEGHDHNAPSNLRCISTYELITSVSRSPLMFLALPTDVIVEVIGGLPRAMLPDRDLPIAHGSFVEALYKNQGRAV